MLARMLATPPANENTMTWDGWAKAIVEPSALTAGFGRRKFPT